MLFNSFVFPVFFLTVWALYLCLKHKPQNVMVTNLGILGFFKYFNFFAASFERVVAPLGLHPDFVTLNILLPVGISFYTFQSRLGKRSPVISKSNRKANRSKSPRRRKKRRFGRNVIRVVFSHSP
jgi:hypothetical protein